MGCHPVIHHYSRKGMLSLEYLGRAGSSPGDSCLPAAASTAPTALLGCIVGKALRA